MSKKSWGVTRSNWIIIFICFFPTVVMLANGSLFNRHNIAAEDALKPYIYVLFAVSFVTVILLAIKWRRQREKHIPEDESSL